VYQREADDADTLGACADGKVGAQITDANNFFTMPDAHTVGGAPIPINAIYGYEWIGAPGGWDSGMVDATGLGRVPQCIWMGVSTSGCTGNPKRRLDGQQLTGAVA
jgi:hypothetical protein